MAETLAYQGQLVVVTCWCGMRHAIPAELDDFQDRQHDNGQHQTSIYCPLGHTHIRAGKGEAEKLRERLEAQQRLATSLTARLDQEKAAHSATRGQLTKTKKRVANGVCPCCKRSFVNLGRHMAGKHPGYTNEPGGDQ